MNKHNVRDSRGRFVKASLLRKEASAKNAYCFDGRFVVVKCEYNPSRILEFNIYAKDLYDKSKLVLLDGFWENTTWRGYKRLDAANKYAENVEKAIGYMTSQGEKRATNWMC